MDEITTGQLAAATGLSEKAIRLYADRGLLQARRDAGGGTRFFDGEQLMRARLIRLLRELALSLDEVGMVVDAPDRVSRFDELWSGRRSGAAIALAAGEYVRSVLTGTPAPDLPVLQRDVPERLLLCTTRRATLAELAHVIPEATGGLFEVLHGASGELVAPPFVEYHERATEGFPARITACAPIGEPLRPPAGFQVTVDPAHREAYVELDQDGAADQTRLVVIHDHLSTGRATAPVAVFGDNREIYLPSWGTGRPGPVMEVAVAIATT